jgi:alkylated DNA repair dioxygenase AlkB
MERIPILSCEDELWFDEYFISNSDIDLLFRLLRDETDWIQPQIRMFGKWVDQPRLMSWQAVDDLKYSYSGITLNPRPFSSVVSQIASKIQQKTGVSFNSVLINYYRNGQDSMGWHADDEPELGADPIIASVSLGEARDFLLRHNTRKELNLKLPLPSGSLLLMGKGIQKNWKHALPKRKHAGPRINLTFRKILIAE